MIPPNRDDSQQRVRVVFLGTPDFVVPVLGALLAAPDLDVALVVTQPDRPAGRGRQLVASPVKQFAIAHGLPVFQPQRLRGPEVIEQMRAVDADLYVIAAYGQILRQAILDLPRHGCLNVHPSLLPRHRGPSPIASAILAGDEETGVTIMLTDRGMDTGPILTQERVPQPRGATTAALTPHLFELGAALLLRVIPDWLGGAIVPQPQDANNATVTRTFTKADGAIDWTTAALNIERQVHAFNPWPRAYTFDRGKRLIVLDARALMDSGEAGTGISEALPGTIVALDANGPIVATGEGKLLLPQVQPEGRRALNGSEFARNQLGLVGRRLGLHTGGGDGT